MCLDPLGRTQILVAEAISMLAEAEGKRAAHDPGVGEAVRARLREMEERLREVQAGFSRREAWRVTREIIREVAIIGIELLLRALTTSCNCSLAAVVTSYAWFNNPTLASRERHVARGTRARRWCHRVVPVARGTRQAGAHA